MAIRARAAGRERSERGIARGGRRLSRAAGYSAVRGFLAQLVVPRAALPGDCLCRGQFAAFRAFMLVARALCCLMPLCCLILHFAHNPAAEGSRKNRRRRFDAGLSMSAAGGSPTLDFPRRCGRGAGGSPTLDFPRWRGAGARRGQVADAGFFALARRGGAALDGPRLTEGSRAPKRAGEKACAARRPGGLKGVSRHAVGRGKSFSWPRRFVFVPTHSWLFPAHSPRSLPWNAQHTFACFPTHHGL